MLISSFLFSALILPVSQGNASCETGGAANVYCPYWNVTYKVTTTILGPSIEITCMTGGQFTCESVKGGGSQK